MKLDEVKGVYTALITPFKKSNGNLAVDWDGLMHNVWFQVAANCGLVPAGTTGESSTLDWREHDNVISNVAQWSSDHVPVFAGTGSNNTAEALRASEMAASHQHMTGLLLVDCYYTRPPSHQLRQNYYEVIAKKFPEMTIIPYVIPGRTATKLSVDDLQILSRNCSNVRAVKEATGDLERMVETRKKLGPNFSIMSGDDDKTYEMIERKDIAANGVISVVSNIAPYALKDMVDALHRKDYNTASKLRASLDPLFKIVTVEVDEGNGMVRYPNPEPIKAAMSGLGLPAGDCRMPLGNMSQKALDKVRSSLLEVYEKSPDVLRPLADFYRVNLADRLSNKSNWE